MTQDAIITEQETLPRMISAWGMQKKYIVVLDMVDSVRHIERDELGVVNDWLRFTHWVRRHTLPQLGGTMVKSLGDGMLVTFAEPTGAVQAALEMHRLLGAMTRAPARVPGGAEQISLRIGIHMGDVLVDDVDIYGHAVNVAARITKHGRPGDTLVSAAFRRSLPDAAQGVLEDMGHSVLKNVFLPMHVYRVKRIAPAQRVWVPHHERRGTLRRRIGYISRLHGVSALLQQRSEP